MTATLDPTLSAAVLWPCASNGDASAPFVERDDEANVFADDEEAAYAVAKAVNGIVVYAPMMGARGPRLQPAVYPWPDEDDEATA